MPQRRPERLVVSLEVHPVLDVLVLDEPNAEHRVLAERLGREAVAPARLDDARAQAAADVVQVLVGAGLGKDVERGVARRRADRIAVQGAARPRQFLAGELPPIERAHHLGPPDDARHREAPRPSPCRRSRRRARRRSAPGRRPRRSGSR